MKFIKVKNTDGETLYLQADKIVSIWPSETNPTSNVQTTTWDHIAMAAEELIAKIGGEIVE